ncbi:MAG: DUF3987 domain-containing protein [Waddliaceae bacterium]
MSDSKKNAAQAISGNQSQFRSVLDTTNNSLFGNNNQSQVNLPDKTISQQFLTLIDEDAEFFTFQTFDDGKRKNSRLSRIFHGSLDQHFDELSLLQKQGAGVFVVVNGTDGAGRKADNIKQVRAFFVDLDSGFLEPILSAPVAPHILVESSSGKYHAYWVVNNCPLECFSEIQKALAQRFSGDPSVHDLSRVMRVPGFIHQKGVPFQTHILEASGSLPIPFDEFVSEFKLELAKETNTSGPDPILDQLRKRKMVKSKDNRSGCYSIRCPWENLHSSVDLGTKYYQAGFNGYTAPGFHCFHDHCKGKTIHDLRSFLGCCEPWGEPKPITTELLPVRSFDADLLLPQILRDWIVDEAERMPCAIDFIATSAVVAIGSLIGARCSIKPKRNDDWGVIPNLWGGVIGLPSSKKSPAAEIGLRPLEKITAKVREAHRNELQQYETQKTIFDAKKEAIEYQIKSAAKGKKGCLDELGKELNEIRKEAPKAPQLRRYKTNDTTIEKLGELLRDNPGGMLIHRDELVGLIASWEKEGREGDRSFFLESWNGNSSFDTDRIKRGWIFIPNLCTSIFGGMQPDKLTIYLNQAANALSNDGMLQRFQVLVYPDHRQWEWRDQSPNEFARQRVYLLFETLASFDPLDWGAMQSDDGKCPYFHFDEEAQKIFIEWSQELHQKKIPNEDNPLMEQHLAKYDKLFPSLALIFHLMNCASGGIKGPISKEAALLAKEWCLYLETHARRCYGLLADEGLKAAQALSKKIAQGKLKDNFTARDVRRNQWRFLTTDHAVQSALDWLEDEGWVRSDEVRGGGNAGGRPTRRYRVHPNFLEVSIKTPENP